MSIFSAKNTVTSLPRLLISGIFLRLNLCMNIKMTSESLQISALFWILWYKRYRICVYHDLNKANIQAIWFTLILFLILLAICKNMKDLSQEIKSAAVYYLISYDCELVVQESNQHSEQSQGKKFQRHLWHKIHWINYIWSQPKRILKNLKQFQRLLLK